MSIISFLQNFHLFFPILIIGFFFALFIILNPRKGLVLIAFTSVLDRIQRIPGMPYINFAKGCGFLVLVAWISHGILHKRRILLKSTLEKPLLGFLFAFLYSTLGTSVYLEINRLDRTFSFISMILLLYMVFYFARSRRQVESLLLAFSVGILINFSSSIYQIITGSMPTSLIGKSITHSQQGGIRAVGLSMDPNGAAALYVLFFPIFLSMFYTNQNAKRRYYFLVCSLTCLIGVGLSLSRAGMLAASGAFIILVIHALSHKGKFEKETTVALAFMRRQKRILPLMIILIVGLFIIFNLSEGFITRVPTIGKSSADPSIINRQLMFKVGVRLLFDRVPVLGLGCGNFRFYSQQYGNQLRTMAHNVYLTIATEQGLLGLFFFLWLVVNYIKLMVRAYRNARTDSDYWMNVGFLVSFIAYVVIDGFFLDNIYNNFLWFTMGLGCATARLSMSPEASQNEPNC